MLPGGTSAGDKDAMVAHVLSDGTVAWTAQFGSSGEDKGFAAARAADGGVYVGGSAGGAMPGTTSAGGYDGWIAKFDADGARQWITSIGTTATDQVSALVPTATGVAAAGFTGGMLGAASLGDNDAFVTGLTADGVVEWTTQDGSGGDDRAAALTTDAAGALLVVGHTSGAIGASNGGVDIFSMTLSPRGAVADRAQLGSTARDGADEYDESNLFIAGGGSTWVQALTYGQVDGATNAGSGDVLLTRLGFDAVVDASAGAPVAGGGGGPVASASGALAFTGADVAGVAALALLLVAAGAVLARHRRAQSPWGSATE